MATILNRDIPNSNYEQLLDEMEVAGYKLYKESVDDILDGSCNISGDSYEFIFYTDLTQQEIDDIDLVISNHVPNTNWEDLKKFKINDSFEDPSNLDYDILGFHKKRTITFGELRLTQYYRNYDGVTHSDLIVEETRDYTRDVNGLVQHRVQQSKWYLKNGSIGETKTTTKYYTLPEAIQEGLDRRGNIISQTKAYVLSQIGQLYSFDLLTSVKNEIQLFLDGYTQPLRDAITNSTKPYLNQTIKDGIIENLRLS